MGATEERDGYLSVRLRDKGDLIDGELVETDDRPYQCVDDLRESMASKPDPCDWLLDNSCDWRLRYCIARILRGKYLDLTRDYAGERKTLNTGSPIVAKLRDAFLGGPGGSGTPVSDITGVVETRAERESREASVRERILDIVEKSGCVLEDERDLDRLPPDVLASIIGIADEAARRDSPGALTITPYAGYFVHRLLTPPEELAASRGRYRIDYWSTREAWDGLPVEELWSGEAARIDNREFCRRLMKSVDGFLSKANAMVSATYGLNESLRKRLAKARREKGEFIRVLAGEPDDPYIERIRETIASGGKWDARREERRGYDRGTTRWGNYGNPAEMSALITQKGTRVLGRIRSDPGLRRKFDSLTIRVNRMNPGGRSPNIGKKGELEGYLRFCFDVAQGTLPMYAIIELVLEKCEELRPVSMLGADNRRPRNGSLSADDAAALEMERSFTDTQEG